MIFRNPIENIEIPEVPLTQFVLSRATKFAHRPALIEGLTGRTYTYGEFTKCVRSAAASLAARGFTKGDVFAIYSPNLPEYGIAFHAVASLGGINTTINPLYTAEEVAQQLQDSNAKLLVTAPQCLDKVLQATEGSSVREIFVFGEAEGATPFASLLNNDTEPPEVEINPREDLVALPYSSGTTGLPKGVMLTHYNLVANICQMEAARFLSDDEVLIGVLPLFHIYGLVVILNAGLAKGAAIVTLPRFELEGFLQAMQDYRVTMANVVPPIILALAKSPLVERYDLSHLKTVFSGAAPLSEAVARACAERLNCRIRQGYGMTETSPVTHMVPAEPVQGKLGSVGPIVPHTECKIVDTGTGAELDRHQEGEICVRGPQVMKGYLNRLEATAKTIDMDDWLHTGDIGYADDDDYFFIVDRVKELIKYKGFQVAPAELEGMLLQHAAVADAAVVPSPDEEAGEVPKAFIVLKGETSAEEIMEFVNARVAPHKKIRKVEVIEQIPKSAAGKILRRVLVERERGKNEAGA